jgi:hypothetical protein
MLAWVAIKPALQSGEIKASDLVLSVRITSIFLGARCQLTLFHHLSRVYSETLTAKGFTQESMFRALCKK